MSTDLRQASVFYSWESDLDPRTTRNLIEGCLHTAIQRLGRDDDLEVHPSFDCDARGVSGSPVILDAIPEKIDNCTAFVADVSIINSGAPSRPTPNPNVAIELGYAIKACGWDRILPVYNYHYGTIDDLHFDISERRVIAYTLSNDPTPEDLTSAKENLVAIFMTRLKEIMKLSRDSILDIQIGVADTEQLFGHEHDCRLVRCLFSDIPHGGYPNCERYTSSGTPGMRMLDMTLNRDFFREVADYSDHKEFDTTVRVCRHQSLKRNAPVAAS